MGCPAWEVHLVGMEALVAQARQAAKAGCLVGALVEGTAGRAARAVAG